LLRGLAKPILAPLSSVPLVGIEPTQLAPEASTLFDFAHPSDLLRGLAKPILAPLS